MIRLQRNNEPDLEFTGEEIARSSSRREQDQPRWTELVAYKTESGKWVLQIIGKSALPGESERSEVKVFNSPAEFAAGAYCNDPYTKEYKLSFPAKALMRSLYELLREPAFDLKETI